MPMTVLRIGAFGSLVALAGCSFAGDSLWPALGGNAGEPRMAEQGAAGGEGPQEPPPVQPPELGQTVFVPPAVTEAPSTGTLVGRKIAQHRAELQALQDTLVLRNEQLQAVRQRTTENSQRYHATMAAINARLQLGTTPGNPVLMSQWRAAQQELARLSEDMAEMNGLANDVASDSAMAAYLLEAARATYALTGAIDEDHRQLAVLEDETNRTIVLIDRLLSELSEDIGRQTSYIGAERRNLSTTALAIRSGEILGDSLFNRALANAVQAGAPSVAAEVPVADAGQQPLVRIRFDRPDVAFEQPLYNAISAALERRPQAMFDLVAVAAAGTTPAETALNLSRSRQNAADVFRALTEMGLPAERVRLSSTSSADVPTNEVRIHVQ